MPTTHELTRGNSSVQVNSKDVDYLLGLIRKDVRYQRSRSAAHKNNGANANATKIQKREELAEKLTLLRKG